ncbi:MAG TPA: 2'-5' RNA ligase family protein [Jatrophihabitantaceae bacterium]|jgi:2'-5' RNA ligase
MTSAQVGDTGLVLRVPEVDPVVDRWRARYDPVAPLGVPAHVTVLYPWIPADVLTDDDLAAIAGIAVATDPIELTFAAVGYFPDVLWLDPQPGEAILALIAAVSARWPDYRPYGGAYGDQPVPHLTVADKTDPAQLGHIVADIERSLPVHSRVAELSLVVRRADGWKLDATFAFRDQPKDA